jgi:hypothetical protein
MDLTGFAHWRAGLIGLGLVLGVSLSGCGTNIPRLLAEDSALVWEADEFLASVEDMNLGLERSFYRVELERTRACKALYKAVEIRVVRELHEGPLPFGDKFVYDAKLLIALLMPMGSVERCRAAIQRYRLEYAKLRDAVALRDDAAH